MMGFFYYMFFEIFKIFLCLWCNGSIKNANKTLPVGGRLQQTNKPNFSDKKKGRGSNPRGHTKCRCSSIGRARKRNKPVPVGGKVQQTNRYWLLTTGLQVRTLPSTQMDWWCRRFVTSDWKSEGTCSIQVQSTNGEVTQLVEWGAENALAAWFDSRLHHQTTADTSPSW